MNLDTEKEEIRKELELNAAKGTINYLIHELAQARLKEKPGDEVWTYWWAATGTPKPEVGTDYDKDTLQYWNEPSQVFIYCYDINDSGFLYRYIATDTRQDGGEEL